MLKPNQVISRATLRMQDLLPAVLETLDSEDTIATAEVLTDAGMTRPSFLLIDNDADWWDTEDAQNLYEDALEALDRFVPRGYYLGMHIGDGALLGVWLVEEEDAHEENAQPASYIRLIAPNTRNGAPRRLCVITDSDDVTFVLDEGYQGDYTHEKFPGARLLGTFETTIRQYNALKREYGLTKSRNTND